MFYFTYTSVLYSVFWFILRQRNCIGHDLAPPSFNWLIQLTKSYVLLILIFPFTLIFLP